ncbi:hypothetical protein M4D54_09665 [Brachybacterium sp. p3-SID1565]|uniref:hypothetical protein n=1 Tax=Brachybacterium sp. p3-SID1565 TaxID=2916046 RepID=UPI0021A6417C|nr:hypothetical protein [Brachybacterium sp. p3-SID1565]MCT1385885.1 hypothetical protein [Brachybacterium sp. p3-SID1565]
MTQQNIENLIELLDLQPQTDTGNDDFAFGNYVEFPRASQIDPDLIPAVLDALRVPLPFAGAVTAVSLRWLPTLSSITRILVLGALGEPSVSTTSEGEFLLTFPTLDARSEETLELVDHLLPTALYEHDLPSSHQYWQPDPEDLNGDPDDELFDLYRLRPVSLGTLIDELEALRAMFETTQEPTVQKAILLACFSLVESFTRQRALLNAPRFPASPQVEQLVLDLLRREVQDDGRRNRVVKALEPEKTWETKIPEWQLRNALAHDIGAVLIGGGEVSYEDASRTVQTRATDKLFHDLIGYANSNLA